jgi:hypothetical protein
METQMTRRIPAGVVSRFRVADALGRLLRLNAPSAAEILPSTTQSKAGITMVLRLSLYEAMASRSNARQCRKPRDASRSFHSARKFLAPWPG